MKIVGVVSSSNKNGNSATLVKEALSGAAKMGASTEIIFLSDYDLKFCNGCMKCMQVGKCILKDSFEDLRKKVTEADGLVFGSPVFCGTMNAMMKNFVDRFGLFERMTSEAMGGKYVIGIATAQGSGAKQTADSLVSFTRGSLFVRGYSSGTLGVVLHGKPVAELPGVKKKCFDLGEKLFKDWSSKKKYPLQNLVSRTIGNLFEKPNYKKFALMGKDGHAKGIFNSLLVRELI